MHWGFRRSHVVERTCFECGEIWTLDSSLAKASPPGRRRRGFSVGVALSAQRDPDLYRGYMLRHWTEARERQTAAGLELAILREVGRCRMCGSTNYIEHTV